MQARAFDRLVAVDADLIFRSSFEYPQLVVHHPLALVPFAIFCAVIILTLHLRCISDIAGFDDHIIIVGRKFECFVKLLFIMACCTTGLMVTDQAHTLFAAIFDEHFDIEILCRLCKIHVMAIAEPVAVPTYIPAFDQ